MPAAWPAIPYEEWSATCETLHGHTQVLGKLAVALAPPQPQLQHGALRVTARGWETNLLPAPDGSGGLVAALDLHVHEAVVEHSDGRSRRVPLTPHRSVGDVTRDVLAAVAELVGPVEIDPKPQEVDWALPLDEDTEHATYEPDQVTDYLAAATQVALVLADLRAPYRGRSTQVNAWWGSFDIAVSLFSGSPAEPPSQDFIMRNSMDAQELALGWWPGYARYTKPAFYAYAHPGPPALAESKLPSASAYWNAELGLFLLDWADVVTAPDPYGVSLEFLRSFVRRACLVCDWDPTLAASVDGDPPPVR
jgi:hypothetical protein